MEPAQALYKLQTLELRIVKDAAHLEAERAKLQEPAALRQARGRLPTQERQLAAIQKELHATEQEVDSVRIKKAAVHDKLYSGRVSVPRELSALEAEETAFARTIAQLEDRQLELMAAAEEAEAALAAGQRQIDADIARWRAEGNEAHDHLAQFEAELESLKGDREALAASISPAHLASYDRLRARMANRPVAIVENNMCQACRVNLPSGDVQRARGADPPHTCENCGRLLYVR